MGKVFFDKIDHKYLNENKISFLNEENSLTAHLQSQKEPSNLVCYIKDRHPFDRWNKDGTLIGFNFFENSHFDKKMTVNYFYMSISKNK